MLVSWPSVQCATSFKVFQKKADEYEWTEVAREERQQLPLKIVIVYFLIGPVNTYAVYAGQS